MIKCLLTKPSLISGPLIPKPKLIPIPTQFQGFTIYPIDSKSSQDIYSNYM